MLTACFELAEVLKKTLSNFKLKTKKGETRSPQVIVGWLPAKRAGETDDEAFPFVRILPLEGYDDMHEGVCSVSILFGAWADDAKGWMDALNAFQYCRIAIASLPGMFLFSACLTEAKGKVIEWKLYEEQYFPQWFAEMKVNMIIDKPEPLPLADNDYRAGLYPQNRSNS